MSPPLYVTLLPACFSHLEIKLLDPTRPEIPVKSHYIMQLFYPFYCFMNNIHNVCSSIREIRELSVLITSQVRSCCDICDEPFFRLSLMASSRNKMIPHGQLLLPHMTSGSFYIHTNNSHKWRLCNGSYFYTRKHLTDTTEHNSF